ncbi:AP2 domain-containing protein [Clostridium sp.]|uniref:AP2 domain-containing protein n=1 Tax=Clostridium sp. TaxID=1506 RepID=UPI001A3D0DD6|nr:AP2 domain-containing protein [Clostridium sp.]MBK5243178.1 hypothetical protein [Clostridium sp.]
MAKIKDLVGQNFGRLTVIERAPDYVSPNGLKSTRWRCICNCKTENPNYVDVISSNLRSGTSKSCGCIAKELADLIGKRYGKLVVTRKVEVKASAGGYVYDRWCCDCDCGNKDISILASSLKLGIKTDCGCIRNNAKNLIGQTFNRLTVVGKAEPYVNPAGNELPQWYCICDCDKENPNYIIVMAAHLKDGHTKSCGCLNIQRIMERCKKYNRYDLKGEYGIGYTFKDEPFYFDLEDYDKIKEICWCANKDGYLMGGSGNSNNSILSRLITNCPDNLRVDHIDHNVYDNRKINLRFATIQENAMNMKKPKNNTSGCKGVYWRADRSKWIAHIMLNNKYIWLGQYSEFEDAVSARLAADKKYFGQYNYYSSTGTNIQGINI